MMELQNEHAEHALAVARMVTVAPTNHHHSVKGRIS